MGKQVAEPVSNNPRAGARRESECL